MKTKLLLLTVVGGFFVLNSCASAVQLTETKKVKEVVFRPKVISKEIEGNLKLKIEPIDAKSINEEIQNSLSFDGGYFSEKSYSYYSYLKEDKDLSPSERRLRETMINLFEGIDDLYKSNQISLVQSYLFKEKVYNNLVVKNSNFGSEKPEYNEFKGNVSGDVNPYYSNGKYFSVYKLTFENTEKQVKDIKIDDFQIFSQGELLYPFKNSYFESKFKEEDGQEKLKTIYRLNMPDNIRILNNQPIVKYFSTPALNNENQNLVVNYIDDGNVVDFTFDVTTKEILTDVNLFPYQIEYKKFDSFLNFNIIKVDNRDYLVKKDKFYLEKNDEIVELLTLNIDSYRKKVNLSVTKFTTNNLMKNAIVVENKNK